MLPEELLPFDGKAHPQDIKLYQAKSGSITYSANSVRPDVAKAAQKLAEFNTNPGPLHMIAADRCICYLNGTKFWAIEYSSQPLESPEFMAFGDAAYGDHSLDRKSTEGYLFMLFGGPVDWKSIKQKTVTKSTTEAELLALSHTASEIFWWIRYFTGIRLELDQDYTVQCDNLQTVRLMIKETPKLATKLKHVDIHQHWLRQEVQAGNLKVEWISTLDQAADGFTKALPRQKFENFINQLGMVDIKELIDDEDA
jgi:hypothetical protein